MLQQHPGVAKAAVVGLPHDTWGEAVTAVVVRDPANPATSAELIAFCRERLAGFETPKDVIFADALPETVGGKVLKYKLRAIHAGRYRAPAGSTVVTGQWHGHQVTWSPRIHRRRDVTSPDARPGPPAAGCRAAASESVLPGQSREDTDAGWGEYPESDDERLYRDRPPHWDDF